MQHLCAPIWNPRWLWWMDSREALASGLSPGLTGRMARFDWAMKIGLKYG